MTSVKQGRIQLGGRRTHVIIITLIAVACVVPMFYIGFPWVDASICVPRAAGRIGVQPTYDALYEYIGQHIVTGMTRADITAILGRVLPIRFSNTHGRNASNDTIGYDVWLNR